MVELPANEAGLAVNGFVAPMFCSTCTTLDCGKQVSSDNRNTQGSIADEISNVECDNFTSGYGALRECHFAIYGLCV